jgi:nucleotide-binding universal stress UspA family protein
MEGFDTFRSILAGEDGSPESQHAIATAVSLAKHYAATLTLLWVRMPPPAEEQAEGYGLEEYRRNQTQCEKHLRQAAEEARGEGVSVIVVEVDGAAAAVEIEKYVTEHTVDLLVVGHRNLSRLRQLLEGSLPEN